ncbi:MAG: adenylyl-sulfate kinase, partial [Kiloniellaceae bacterium]
YIKADVETCEQRDPKGLYKKARTGEIAQFTGVSAPYEPPEAPDLVVDTASDSIAASVEQIIRYIEKAFTLKKGEQAKK